MKVKELIEKLQELNQDKDVLLEGYYGIKEVIDDFDSIGSFYVITSYFS